MYLFWRKLRRKTFNLRHGRTIALMAATMVVCACIQAAIIMPAVAYFYPDVDATVFFATVVGNSIVFPLGFTIPCIILLQEGFGFRPLAHRPRHLRQLFPR